MTVERGIVVLSVTGAAYAKAEDVAPTSSKAIRGTRVRRSMTLLLSARRPLD
jgi:hypothetical protein